MKNNPKISQSAERPNLAPCDWMSFRSWANLHISRKKLHSAEKPQKGRDTLVFPLPLQAYETSSARFKPNLLPSSLH